LRPQLSATERDSLAKVGTRDAEAYRFYLNGRYGLGNFAPESLKAAAGFFQQAVARDPRFAAAYAGLADAYALQGYFGYISGREPFEKARSAAQRSLELDNAISESHISLTMVDILYFWDFSEAEREIHDALAWIIHEVSSQKRKDALKGMMNTGFARPAFPF